MLYFYRDTPVQLLLPKVPAIFLSRYKSAQLWFLDIFFVIISLLYILLYVYLRIFFFYSYSLLIRHNLFYATNYCTVSFTFE